VHASHLCDNATVTELPARGFAAVATRAITPGETVAVFAGAVIGGAELADMSDSARSRAVQIEEDLYLSSPQLPHGNAVNHSCDPNCGLRGANLVVAMRHIAAGEEITYDYATSAGSPYAEFECTCEDWTIPELQLRYRGHFSPYLANRIGRLAGVGAGASRRAYAY
jgi:uncharacterized protein